MFEWIKNLFRKKQKETNANEPATIELKDYISMSITQIFEGVKDAQGKDRDKIEDHLKELFGGAVVPHSPNRTDLKDFPKFYEMEFDIAVTIGKKNSHKSNVEIGAKNLQINVLGISSNFEHTSNSETTNNMISRIKFTLPIIFPSVPHRQM